MTVWANTALAYEQLHPSLKALTEKRGPCTPTSTTSPPTATSSGFRQLAKAFATGEQAELADWCEAEPARTPSHVRGSPASGTGCWSRRSGPDDLVRICTHFADSPKVREIYR
ncbi:hypothetical protein GCM10027569_63150 [Flindersiella endophytica]